MEFMETGEKIGLAITLAVMLSVGALTSCTGAKAVENPKTAPAMEQVVAIEEQVPENKTYEAYEHVFYRRYDNLTEKRNSQNVYGGQIVIPEGYEILDIENFEIKYGYGSQTSGFDVWFINNQPVEVKAVYNPAVGAYDYSEPGTVIERNLEEDNPNISLTR